VRTSLTIVAGVVGLGLAVAGCGTSARAVVTTGPGPAALALQQRAEQAGRLSFTGTYSVADRAGTHANVRVYVSPSAYRVDIVEADDTASLFGGPQQRSVACTTGTGATRGTACYVVAAAGAAVPAAFDAGVQRVFSRDLPTLATTTAGFGVIEQRPPAAVTALSPTSRCFVVSHVGSAQPVLQPLVAQVDDGTYCLASGGLPEQLVFASGTLTLTAHGPAPTRAQLSPPATPQPLPAGVHLGSSPGPSVPVVLPTGSPSTS
jgi:hypothetical protein